MKTNRILVVVIAVLLSGFNADVYAQTCNTNMTRSTPDSRFTANGATVTDNQTGLMWAKCAEGLSGSDCTTGSINSYNWQTALNHASSSMLAGHSDWRLPNIKELASIVEIACYEPSINTTYFPNTPTSSDFWSASPNASNSGSAWVVYFGYGDVNSYGRGNGRYVRLVRGGQ